MTILWLRALVARLPGRLAGAIAGVALTIALIGALGVQIASSSATMTRQAIAGVGVDWQVQINHGASFGTRGDRESDSLHSPQERVVCRPSGLRARWQREYANHG